MWINGVDKYIKLTRAPKAFYLLASSSNIKLRIRILDATLFITQLKLTPRLSHADGLSMKRKTHYPVTHTQIKNIAAYSVAQQVSTENAFLGTIPERILIVWLNHRIHWFCQYDSIPLSSLWYDKFCIVLKRSSAPFRTTHNGLLFTLWCYQGS